VRGSSKRTDKQPAIVQIIPSMSSTPVPPPAGVTGMMIRSTVAALDSTWCIAEFLEGLKNAEADREGTHFSFYYFNPLILFADS
jgi:hypothetical protein